MVRGKTILIQLFIAAVILVLSQASAFGDDALRFADLGDLRLENGSVIRDCRLAYRVVGKADSDGGNTVLIPTWLAGTTKELIDLGIIGEGKAIDSTKFCVIAVDSFGNGVSSSPSNSAVQRDRDFPQFSIRDMVTAHHLLVTRYLKLKRLHAVAGISMGGMQAWQWAVSYPGFAARIISIVGSPWLSSNDLLLWAAELAIIENVRACKGEETAAMKALGPMHTLVMWTPRFRSATTRPDALPEFLRGLEKSFEKFNANDWAWQVKAITSHDVRKEFGGSAEKAAQAVKSKALVITSGTDQIIYPEPSLTFSKLTRAETAELNGYCGHLAFVCDREQLRTAVKTFLELP